MNKFRVPTPPSGMMFNTDKRVVDLVIQNLATKTNGFCPCISKHLHSNEDYKCVCKDARETLNCVCKLFIKA